MGKRGPRPTPEAIKILRGTEGKNPRPFAPDEVAGEMQKPDWLGPIASEYWDRNIEILNGRKTVSPAYVDFLAQYCQAWEDFHTAIRTLAAEGEYVQSEKGGLYQHPAMGVKHKAIERIGKFGREFGFSPTSIRDVQVNADSGKDKTKGRFFAG